MKQSGAERIEEAGSVYNLADSPWLHPALLQRLQRSKELKDSSSHHRKLLPQLRAPDITSCYNKATESGGWAGIIEHCNNDHFAIIKTHRLA